MRHLAGKTLTLTGLSILLFGIQHKAQANDDWLFGGDMAPPAVGLRGAVGRPRACCRVRATKWGGGKQ